MVKVSYVKNGASGDRKKWSDLQLLRSDNYRVTLKTKKATMSFDYFVPIGTKPDFTPERFLPTLQSSTNTRLTNFFKENNI